MLTFQRARERSSGPSHHRRLCCPPGSTGTTPASDSLPAPRPLPGSSPVIGRRWSAGTASPLQPGRASPVPAATPLNVPRPLRRGVPRGCVSRIFTASMAFTVNNAARLSSLNVYRRGRLRFTLRTAQLLPLQGFRRWASARPVSRPDRQPATGLPGDYPDRTFTGWRRRASDQVITAGRSPPDLWAHQLEYYSRPAVGPAGLAGASGEEVDEQGDEDLVGDAVPLPVEDSCVTVGDGRRDSLGDMAGGFAALPAGQGQRGRGDVAEPVVWYAPLLPSLSS